MPITLNGTTGIVGPDGSAASPAIQGGDANTGMFFPAADTIAFATAGTEDMRITSVGDVGIGTSSPAGRLQVTKNGAEVARFTNSLSNGGDWEFKIGGGGFEDRRLMITDKFSGADNVRVGIDSSGNFQFNSGYGSAAVAYGCRAWVNFNGTGTVAIRASGNVSSITDNGTGDYTVNFTTALADANYSVGSCVAVDFSNTGSRVVNLAGAAPTTTACRISTVLPGTGNQDCLYVAIQVMR